MYQTAGRLLRTFGKGMFALPHGIHVDLEGNVWVTAMVLQDGRGQGATGNGPDIFSAPSDVVVGSSCVGTRPGLRLTDAVS